MSIASYMRFGDLKLGDYVEITVFQVRWVGKVTRVTDLLNGANEPQREVTISYGPGLTESIIVDRLNHSVLK